MFYRGTLLKDLLAMIDERNNVGLKGCFLKEWSIPFFDVAGTMGVV
jgi:hypothetical protein